MSLLVNKKLYATTGAILLLPVCYFAMAAEGHPALILISAHIISALAVFLISLSHRRKLNIIPLILGLALHCLAYFVTYEIFTSDAGDNTRR